MGDPAAGTVPPRRLRTNLRWTLFGTLGQSAGQWLQFILLARTGGAGELGEYAYALALTAPVMMFASLQLRGLIASDQAGRFRFQEYRRLAGLTTLVAAAVVAALALATPARGGGWLVLLAVCVMRAAEALGDVYYGLWQQHERMEVLGWGRAIGAASTVALTVAAALLGAGAAGIAAGAAGGSLLALAYLHRSTARDAGLVQVLSPTEPVRSGRHLWRLAVEGFPLGFILLLTSLQPNIPRYFVEYRGGQAALGLFAAVSQLTSAGNLFVGALGSAALPRLASHVAAGDLPAFRTLSRKLVLVGVALGLGGVALSALAGRLVLSLVYGPAFASGHDLLVVLSLAAGAGFVAAFLGWALTAARVIRVQPIILAASLLVLAAGCALLVPSHGSVGAAWALFASSVIQAAGSQLAMGRVSGRAGAPHA